MNLLFVHGMGATPFDWLPTAWRLKKHGYRTATFSYFASCQSLAGIRQRLARRLAVMASEGEYALIGHSLGGVLLRDALCSLPADVRPPRHLFLVGSPMTATQTNRDLSRFKLYQLLFGECGQLVASNEQMQAVGVPGLPITCVAGTKGNASRFNGQANDGIVLESELCPGLFADVVHIEASHPLLPAHRQLPQLIHQRLGGDAIRPGAA